MRLNGSDAGTRINDHLAGKTVEMLGKDGQWLIIFTTDGHRYRVGWANDDGPVEGEPYLAGQDFVVKLQGVTLQGIAKM